MSEIYAKPTIKLHLACIIAKAKLFQFLIKPYSNHIFSIFNNAFNNVEN